jgi:hypothetical protein
VVAVALRLLSIDEAVGVETAANLKVSKAAVVAFAVVAVDNENDTVDLPLGRTLMVVVIVVHANDPHLLPYSSSKSITANDGRGGFILHFRYLLEVLQ